MALIILNHSEFSAANLWSCAVPCRECHHHELPASPMLVRGAEFCRWVFPTSSIRCVWKWVGWSSELWLYNPLELGCPIFSQTQFHWGQRMKIKKHWILCHVIFRQTLLLASEKNTCCRGFVQTNWDWLTLKLLPEKHRIPAQKKSDYRPHIYVYIYIRSKEIQYHIWYNVYNSWIFEFIFKF